MGYWKEETITTYLLIIDNLKLSNYKNVCQKASFFIAKKAYVSKPNSFNLWIVELCSTSIKCDLYWVVNVLITIIVTLLTNFVWLFYIITKIISCETKLYVISEALSKWLNKRQI